MGLRRTAYFCLFALLALPIGNPRAALLEAQWTQVIEHAEWSPRDAAGAIVHDEQMWLLGGWPGSGIPTLRDVWKSADGTTWEKIVEPAPWRHADLAMTNSFGGKLWLMGGISNPRLPDESLSNEVWSSTNGRDWTFVAHAPWAPREGGATVVFKDRMWVFGGRTGRGGSYANDVWSSADGKEWTQSAAAPWQARAFHAAVVFGGRVWILGGGEWEQSPVMLNDVWSSADGEHWEQAPKPEWSPRIWVNAAVYRDRIWIIGGRYAEDRDAIALWHSTDGISWSELPAPENYKGRHAAALFVVNDKLWIAGGLAGRVSNDVWRLWLPR